MSDSPLDRLVDEWLARVAQAGADLPPDQRAELLADLREHISVARADLAPETEAGVRTILDRLGDPATIAQEARQQAPAAPPAVERPAGSRRVGIWIAVALAVVALVCIGCGVAGLGLFGLRVESGSSDSGQQGRPIPVPSATVVPYPGR